MHLPSNRLIVGMVRPEPGRLLPAETPSVYLWRRQWPCGDVADGAPSGALC